MFSSSSTATQAVASTTNIATILSQATSMLRLQTFPQIIGQLVASSECKLPLQKTRQHMRTKLANDHWTSPKALSRGCRDALELLIGDLGGERIWEASKRQARFLLSKPYPENEARARRYER